MEQAAFPTALKLAKVFSKLKKYSSNSVDNYWPISIFSTISKVLENIILIRLMNHLSSNSILKTQQHRFIKSRYPISALTNFIEQVLDQLEERNAASTLFLDFTKAFNCLSHDLLVEKMERIGNKRNYLTMNVNLYKRQDTNSGNNLHHN